MCLFSTVSVCGSFSWQASPIDGMSRYHYDPPWTVELALRMDVPQMPTGGVPAAAETFEVYSSLVAPDIMSAFNRIRSLPLP